MLALSRSCWWPTCFDVAATGPGQGARPAPYAGYKVAGCTRVGSTISEWSNKSCRSKIGGYASSPDHFARVHGHALAAGLAPEGGYRVYHNFVLCLPRFGILVSIEAGRPEAWFPGQLGSHQICFSGIYLSRDFKRVEVPRNPMKSPFCFWCLVGVKFLRSL
jgi:hypothetical protein